MPVYIFEHPDKGEYKEIVQKMDDEHVYVDDEGLEWRRVWTLPTASVGLESDPDSSQQFVDKTAGWNAGDMWDYSKDLSEKRKAKRGFDHIKKKHDDQRSKKISDIKRQRRERVTKKK